MISIELISRGEPALRNTLRSIVQQDFRDFELICVDSSRNKETLDLLSTYNCRLIDLPERTGHLLARYEAHKYAKGERSLLLDSTRPLFPNALDTLNKVYYNYDMVVIKAASVGNGFWVEQAEKLREINEQQIWRLKKEAVAFLLPRLFNKSILTDAFDSIISQNQGLYEDISYGEHHLIFEECWKRSKNIAMTEERLMYHFEDDSLFRIVSKYYRYGRAQKNLKRIRNSNTNKFGTHLRGGASLFKRIQTLPISIARGAPFFIGYIVSKRI